MVASDGDNKSFGADDLDATIGERVISSNMTCG
jgi:hypothetical protein